MIVITARNVSDAFRQGMLLVQQIGIPRESRGGSTITLPMPVTTMYRSPTERVLFCKARDANPFFHLFESFWMLAGERDARWLDTYVRDFSARFAEDNGQMHGAYGHRWRSNFGFDQIDRIVSVLHEDPDSRQAVLQMWNPDQDLGSKVRDKPCNLSVVFRVRTRAKRLVLDMTVMCRSNDIVMGAYGANAVHMSVLQEYVACLLGIDVGIYWQVSNDYHIYVQDAEKTKFSTISWADPNSADNRYIDGVRDRVAGLRPSPLFETATVGELDEKLPEWLREPCEVPKGRFCPPVFAELLVPMARAHEAYRTRSYLAAQAHMLTVQHEDWRVAGQEWLDRRNK